MNRNQLIAAWVMIGFITSVFIFAANHIVEMRDTILETPMPKFFETQLQVEVINLRINRYKELINNEILRAIFLSIPCIFIGGLLIYTLRDKKK